MQAISQASHEGLTQASGQGFCIFSPEKAVGFQLLRIPTCSDEVCSETRLVLARGKKSEEFS